MKKLFDFCEDSHVMIDWMLPLAASHDGQSCCDKLEDLLIENTADELAEVFGQKPLLSYDVEDEDGELSERERQEVFCEWLTDRQMRGELLGYLVSFRCPVRTYHDSGKGFGYSMGHCHCKIVYVAEADDDSIIAVIKPHADGWAELDKKETKAAAKA